MNVKLTDSQKQQILNSTDLYAIMQKILLRENKIRRNQEHFWVVGLNNINKILFIELISLGAVNRVQVNPPEVFRMGIYKLATKMILVHNHPSGSALPTKPDLDVTNKLLKVGEIIKIAVIDHLIITEESYISFEDSGYMAELKRDDTYRVVGELETQIKALQIDAEKEKAKKEQQTKMAKKMLSDGMSIEMVAKYSGLTKKQVEKLKSEG